MSEEEQLDLGSAQLYDLPNELLLQVAFKLDVDSKLQFGSTCRRFYPISRDPTLWSDITWESNEKSRNFLNMCVGIKLSNNCLKNLSLTCSGLTLPLSRSMHHITACKSLQSISLTNFKCTFNQIGQLLQLPILTELHIIPDHCQYCLFREIAAKKCPLKVLSISSNSFDFRGWVDSGYIPPYLRVILTNKFYSEELDNGFSEHNNDIWNYEPIYPVRHEARLSFHQPTANFFSRSSVPILQYSFRPHHLRPFVYRFPHGNDMHPLALVKDSFGSNMFSGVFTFPDIVEAQYLDVSSECITLLHLYGQLQTTGTNLQTLARNYPNLLKLDLQKSKEFLCDLDGLHAIALSCSKLRSLNIATDDCHLPINRERLWQVISKMNNLTVLKVSCHSIPIETDPVVLPTLKAIYILHEPAYLESRYSTYFTDQHFNFFTSIASLSFFRFESIPSISVISGLTNILHSFANLTHLFIRKYAGNELTLPLDSSCYRNLENMYLRCDDFTFSNELANTISKCEHMKVLALQISSISVTSIKTLFDSLISLLIFHVTTTCHSAFTSRKAAYAFTRYLFQEAKSQGRNLDIQILSRSYRPLLDSIQLDMHFNL